MPACILGCPIMTVHAGCMFQHNLWRKKEDMIFAHSNIQLSPILVFKTLIFVIKTLENQETPVVNTGT